MAIIGAGGIGRALIELLEPHDVEVLAVTRRGPRRHAAGRAARRGAGARADHFVIAAPATDDTRHLVGAAELAAMKPHSWLVNIARGSLIDTDALVRGARARSDRRRGARRHRPRAAARRPPAVDRAARADHAARRQPAVDDGPRPGRARAARTCAASRPARSCSRRSSPIAATERARARPSISSARRRGPRSPGPRRPCPRAACRSRRSARSRVAQLRRDVVERPRGRSSCGSSSGTQMHLVVLPGLVGSMRSTRDRADLDHAARERRLADAAPSRRAASPSSATRVRDEAVVGRDRRPRRTGSGRA